jgi:hypothetical protein
MSTMNPFVQIYSQGGWNRLGSGHGSHPSYTERYRTFLEHFIHYNHIQSLVDFGCGDWAFSSMVNWQGASYLGLDCVPAVIRANKMRYERGSVRFGLVEFGDFSIPPCDLLIAKDVLQHLSNRNVLEFLRQSRNTKHVLLTNDYIWGDNTDIADGGYRHLDLTKPPFNERGQIVFAFGSMPDEKVAFLQYNG